jgi:hypothetical protein
MQPSLRRKDGQSLTQLSSSVKLCGRDADPHRACVKRHAAGGRSGFMGLIETGSKFEH